MTEDINIPEDVLVVQKIGYMVKKGIYIIEIFRTREEAETFTKEIYETIK
jgi:hypothetical protein